MINIKVYNTYQVTSYHQEENCEILCSTIVKEAEAVSADLVPKAKEVYAIFKKAITLFGKCHNLYNGGVLTDYKINELGEHANYY